MAHHCLGGSRFFFQDFFSSSGIVNLYNRMRMQINEFNYSVYLDVNLYKRMQMQNQIFYLLGRTLHEMLYVPSRL
jgi:hypothetical protein